MSSRVRRTRVLTTSALLAAAAVTASALIATGSPASGLRPSEVSVAGSTASRAPCPRLRLADHWYGDNARLIQRVIDRRGTCSHPQGGPRQLPYAVFDWDNTVIKNDISDQTIFWMLRHDQLLQPPRRDWHTTSRYMTDVAAAALRRACGPLARPGERLPTSTNVRCADELLSFRKEQVTTGGAEAFAGYDHREMEASYAWVAQLQQGRTPQQVRRIAGRARLAALRAPIGATQRVGSGLETAWIRYYPEVRDLVRTLKRAGIEPWIISASPQEFADVWGRGVGIDRAHTIGIRTLRKHGRITSHLEGCGDVADGEDAIMPYIDGKRCFINKLILGIDGAPALSPAPRWRRQVLAAGDATTDVTMVRDATGVHIALNRNRAELMCVAYDNADGRWAINPMFIQPLPKYPGLYPCSTTAYVDRDGDEGPVRRPDGSIIPDQEDTVHG